MKITLDNNVVANVSKGTTVLKLAEDISPGLAKNVICGRIEEKLIDLNDTISKNCKLEFITNKNQEAYDVINHTACHILAQAVKEVFPSCKLGQFYGDRNGFYHDFELKKALTEDDLQMIQEEVEKIIKANFKTKRASISKEEALLNMAAKEEPYRIEELELKKESMVTTFEQGEFYDVCDYPHTRSSGKIKSIKLTNFRTVKRSELLYFDSVFTRIEGVAFFRATELEKYLSGIEEAKWRDHKKIGKALELFTFSEQKGGFVSWLPNGMKIYNALLDFWREVHEQNGYEEISAPMLSYKSASETSDFLSRTIDDFMVSGGDDELFLKPVNCFDAINIFKFKERQISDLPLRYSECDILHRTMKDEDLNGLFALKEFRQDDAHCFVSQEQIESEILHILDLADKFYKTFGLSYSVEFATRPSEYAGTKKDWDNIEGIIKQVLNNRFGEYSYQIKAGEGGYFAPRVDIIMTDALNRKWRTGCFQIDAQSPRKFGLKCTSEDGNIITPVAIHRTIYGSFERFVGLLIEHFTGSFPFWISPVQILFVANQDNSEIAKKVVSAFRASKIRCEIMFGDYTNEQISSIISERKIPYVAVVGEETEDTQNLLLHIRGVENQTIVAIEDLLESLSELNTTRKLNLIKKF